MKTLFLHIACILIIKCAVAQNHHSRFESMDVQHYKFEIHLNDTTNRIEGIAQVSIKFLKTIEDFTLDLVGTRDKGTGMSVEFVEHKGEGLSFLHAENELGVHLEKPTVAGQTLKFQINYSGIPADGLVISQNSHGQRTFFGDNWPDRAKHWLPSVDHPSDKATLEFQVYAPKHYEVVANGYLLEKKELDNDLEFTHWKSDVPISTKLMVIGLADFAVGNKSTFNYIPVSSWVFEKDKEKGFENYKYGTEALEYFIHLLGPYSYEKLAHVQSKTRYGGMENASCIFYHERTATGNRSQEGLFAHEVAHQWFGNSVTEQNWHHLWLSEGFATYLTHVYKQHFHGEKEFREGLKNDRERVIQYSKRHLAPIIDTTVTEYINLLNTNSYQKAGWVLHMLRQELGDFRFFEGLRKYYADFQNSTALTKDFQMVMESVSGKDLEQFFKQWLWTAGHPKLTVWWEQEFDTEIDLCIRQSQSHHIFRFPMEVKTIYTDGTEELSTYLINKEINKFTISLKREVKEFEIDPNKKLLFELENP